jgi:alpha-tubulin suppressor-like RCC1 family protein
MDYRVVVHMLGAVMLKKIFHSLIAAVIATTPLSASASDQYYFRYKTPISMQIPPVTDEEYGIGNDIVAYYVTPTGRPFQKKIPVATKDVVNWVKDSGSIPSGIHLDEAAGILSGTALLPDAQTVLFHGYDAQDHKIARAEVHFTVFEPVGSEAIVDFYGHTGSYFFGVIPSPDGVDVYSWEVVGDQPLPAGMSMTGSGFEGTPEKAGTYDIMLRGFDYLGREVAFATGTFLVEDGPKIEEVVSGIAKGAATTREEFGDQVADKGEQQTFSIHPTVTNSLGTVTYKLVPATIRPSGIAFASATGALRGAFDDFDTSASFQIEARDSYDGSTGRSNVFKLTTLPATLDLSLMPDLIGYVASPYYQKLTSAGVVSGATWSVVSGTLPDNITLNPSTGELTGTPTTTEIQSDIVIAVSGTGMVPAQSSPFKFTIFSEKITGSTNPLAVRVNQPFSTDGVTIKTGGSQGYSLSASVLPDGVSLDATTGIMSSTTGIPVAGSYDQKIDVSTPPGLPGSIWQSLQVYNELNIDYGDQTVVRRKFLNAYPTVGENSIVGSPRYTLLPVNGAEIPSWLNFDTSTGRLYGWPMNKSTADVVYGPYKVKVSDGLSEDTSDAFTVTVKERASPTVNINNKSIQRFITNYYGLASVTDAVGAVEYELLNKPANFPSTLRLTTGIGYIYGTSEDEVGTVYQGLQIKVTDAESMTGTSDPFDLMVIEPKGLAGLTGSLNKTFEWTAAVPFTFTLPALSNGFGKLGYTFDTALAGVAITDALTGTVGGIVAGEGTYTLPFQIDDETDRDSAKGTLTLKINPPMVLQADATYPANRASALSLQAPVVTGGTLPLTYTILSGSLPKGVSYADGVFSGTPVVEGSFPLTIEVKDKTGNPQIISFTLVVDKPLPIELGYADTTVLSGYYSYVVPTLKNAVGGISKATWKVTGTLPTGMSFNEPGHAGQFTGVPSTVGVYPDITVEVTDAEGRKQPATIEIGVSLNGAAVFSDVTLTHRKGANFSDALAPTNVVAPLAFTSDDLTALGLVVNGTTGSVTGSFRDAGTYLGGVTVKDHFKKEATATVTFNIVGDLSASGGDATFKRYVDTSGPVPTVLESIGPLTYRLASGTLPSGLSVDPNTGAVSGASDEAGTYPNIVVEAKDLDGVTANTNGFTVTVDERDALELAAPDTYEFRQYTAGSVPVAATNGIGTVTYTISPALPAGIVLGADGQISGTSEFKVDAASYVLTATDSKGGALGTATKAVNISVRERDALEVSGNDVVEFTQYGDAQALFPAVSAIGEVAYSIAPALPDGLDFDTTTGTVSGSSNDEVAAATYVITATDSKGGTLGTATKSISLKVNARAALELGGPADFKFVQHADGIVSFPATNAIGAVTWSVTPDLPADLTFDTATGTISGVAASKQDATDYVITAVDEKGGTLGTASKTVSITIGDRLPLTITTAAAQSVLLDHPYFMSLSADNVVGSADVTWAVVSGQPPAGVTFDPATGSFTGTPTEFGTQASITIRATDAYEGLDERTFVFSVLQDGTPITLTGAGGITRVGQSFDIPVSTASNVVGNPTWSIDAGSTGVSINPKTGKLSGTPSTTYTSNVTLHVTDATGRTADAVVAVTSAPPISVAVASPNVDLVFNHDPAAIPVATATDAVGAVAWTSSGVLPAGVTVDPTTGALVGKPAELGTFGPIYVTAADTLPGTTKSQAFSIKVTMNDDPLELNVTDFVTKVGYPVQTVTPTYGNNLGPVSFFSTDLGSTGLSVSAATGVLSGTALATTDVYVNVSVKDRDTTRVTSKPVHYQVLPNMVVSLPSQVIVSALSDMTPVSPSRMYIIGSATWDELDQSVHKLPEGMSFDATTGMLKGNPQEIGTFGPFTISSVDSLGDRGVSNQFTIKSNPGAIFIGLAAAALPDATKRIDTYSYDFKSNLTYVGMDESELTWALGAGSPPGLTLANGVLSGTPSLSGTYTFDVSASYGGVTAKRTYTLLVKLPTIDLKLATATLPDAKRAVTGKDNSYAFDFKPLATRLNIPADKVVYMIEPLAQGESFPAGLIVSAAGVVSGTATADKGDYSFRVTASFTDSTDENISVTTAYAIKVTDEINFEFNNVVMSAASKRLSYTFDLGTMIEPTTLKGVTTSQIVWSWAVDPARNPATTMATVPAGLSISGSTVSGTPTNSGMYDLIVTASYDGRTISKGFSLVSGLQAISLVLPATLPDSLRGDAYSANLPTLATVTNVPAASINWTLVAPQSVGSGEVSGLPAGVSMNSSGLISGTPTTAGKYTFKITGSWSDTNAVVESINQSQTYTLTVAARTGNYKQVMTGGSVSCGLTADNGVKCWGNKAYTGNSAASNYAIPAFVTGLSSGVKSLGVTGGAALHLCVVTDAGGVRCWGDGDNGKLGNNNGSADALTPVTPAGLTSGVASVSTGSQNSCAVMTDGSLKCWGANANGQIGDGTTTARLAPVTVPGATDVKKVVVGGNHICYLTNGGAVMCSGNNFQGEFGNGNRTSYTSFVAAGGGVNGGAGLTGVKDVTVTNYTTCFILNSGAMKCTGYDVYGEFGTGSITGALVSVPQTSAISPSFISGSNLHYCAVTTSAGAKCWGQGTVGKLGNGSTSDTGAPTNVTGLTSGVLQVAAGTQHSCALMNNGGIKCWGQNSNSQLGATGFSSSLTAVDVSE